MSKKITVELDEDMLNDLVLQDLVDHFENSELNVSQMNALAVVIKFYSNDKEWKAFSKRHQSNLNFKELSL